MGVYFDKSYEQESRNYSWLSLSRPRLSRITAYLEVKIWSLPKHENLTTGKKILWKRGEIAPLFHNIFNISLTSSPITHIYLLNVAVRIIFSSILQIWYVEIRISRSISEGPLEFEITRVDCISVIHQCLHIENIHKNKTHFCTNFVQVFFFFFFFFFFEAKNLAVAYEPDKKRK